MLIPHPLLGLRDSEEFSYLGDATLLARPDGMAADAVDTVARGATALADERRLFLVACTRARIS